MEAVMKWRKQHPDMERGLGYLGEIIEAADHLSALRASQAGKPLSCDGCATRDRIIENAEFLVRGGDRDYALKVLRGEVLLPAPNHPAECSGCGKSHGGPACDFSGIDPRPVEKGG